jgi:hypothetical protein
LNLIFDCLPNGAILDGEAYVHGKTFNYISSSIKTKETTSSAKNIQYHIFDIILDEKVTYDVRYKRICGAYDLALETSITDQMINIGTTIDEMKSSISDEFAIDETESKVTKSIVEDEFMIRFGFQDIFVVPYYHVYSEEKICKYQSKFLEMGYEGAMLKRLGKKSGLYIHGRTNNLMKVKNFDESEGRIVGVESCKERGRKLAMLRVVIGEDEDGEEESILMRLKGEFGDREKILKDPESVIDKYCTYEHFGVSEYGIPRFPVAKCIRYDLD